MLLRDNEKIKQAAINFMEGNAQVIAPAGASKTDIIANRIKNLRAKNVKDGIVAFAFNENAAEELNAAIDQRLSSLKAIVQQIPENEKKTALDYNSWGTANGADTTWNLVLTLAGIENAAAEMEVDDFGQVPLSKEVLLELNPDVLFLPSYIWGEEGASDAFYQQVVEDPALAGVAAIVENQVYIFPERLKNSYSQYLIDAAAAAAEMVYPDLFD